MVYIILTFKNQKVVEKMKETVLHIAPFLFVCLKLSVDSYSGYIYTYIERDLERERVRLYIQSNSRNSTVALLYQLSCKN